MLHFFYCTILLFFKCCAAPALEKYIIERRSMVDLHLKIDIEIALELDTDYTFEYIDLYRKFHPLDCNLCCIYM